MTDSLHGVIPFPSPPPPSRPVNVIPRDELIEQLTRYKREVQRRRWAADPVVWATERLGDALWSGQRHILEAVRDHRRTVVRTCHGVGKSFSAGLISGWWLDTHKPGQAVVVTTAPTGDQVKKILWKEIGRVHVRGGLAGRVNQTEWLMEVDGKEEFVGMGRKPSDYSPVAFQGIHAPFVLVIVDEANGVRGELWNAIDSLLANDESRILEIGNPDVPTGEFFEHCRPGSGYHVIHLSAFDSPNFTGENMPPLVLQQLVGRTYVEEKRKKWAPLWRWASDGARCVPPEDAAVEDTSSPLWQSKVLGIFPKVAEDRTLIPMAWIAAAQERALEPISAGVLGQDVGGGGDSSTIAHARGGHVRILSEDHNPDTMQTCGNLLSTMRERGVQEARVDMIGIGRGVVDRALEVRREEMTRGRPVSWKVIGVNVGEAAHDNEAFENLRAERWWRVREMFERGEIDIDPLDEDLAAELAAIRFERTSKGRLKIESKKDAMARGVRSPNRADAVMLAVGPVERLTQTLSITHAPMSVGEAPSPWGSL